MSLPADIALFVPLAVPFVLGFLIGAVIKKSLKLVVLIAVILIILITTGALSLTFQDLYDKAMLLLPKIYEAGSGLLNIIPYSSITFLLGLAIGLWRG